MNCSRQHRSPSRLPRSQRASVLERRASGSAAAALLLAALLLGCSAAAVKTPSKATFDTSAYRTYDWATAAPVLVAHEERERDAAVLEWTIRDSIDRALAAKGYSQAFGNPDMLVDFGVRLEEKSTETFGEYITYRDLGGKQDMGSSFVFGYEEGSLVVEITDARSKARLWSGSARAVLDDGQDITKLEKSVGQILAAFPASSASGATAAGPPRKQPVNDLGSFRTPEP